jgi:hypothetical protein
MWNVLWPRMPRLVLDLWRLPTELALAHAQRHVAWHRHTVETARQPGPEQAGQLQRAWRDIIAAAFALPFDLARVQHAAGVQLGALPRSLLESQRFERKLEAMERFSLGLLARSV